MSQMTQELRKNIHAMLTAAPGPKQTTRRIVASDGRGSSAKTGNVNWPFASEALGVSPDQVEEARAVLQSRGCPAEFTEDGCPIATGPRHYHKIAKAFGKFHGAHGYVAVGADGKPGKTGREYGLAKQRTSENIQQFIETGRCDDKEIERQIYEVAEGLNQGDF